MTEVVGTKRKYCHVEVMRGYTDPYACTRYYVELSCHVLDSWEDSNPPRYCPYCGRRVVGE